MTKETPGQRPRMSLRDYFAARAMQALIGEMAASVMEERADLETAVNRTARLAYVVADAMFEARRK